MTQDRPLLGIALMLGFCVLAPLGDAVTKLLGEVVPLGQFLLARFAVQAGLLVPLVMATRRPWRLRGIVLRLAALRTLLHVAGIGTMFAALVHLPLADAIAIAFVMPFLLLLLGHYVLGEEVGWRRMAACAVGFCGTLMVIQPAFREVGWPALLPLGVAVIFALFMLTTRHIARDTDPVALQAVSGVMAVVLLAPVLAVAASARATGADIPAALDWSRPESGALALLMTVGALGTLAHLLMTWALRFAPGATLAPMQYLEIPVATAIGLIVFGDLPDPLAALGICVTVASGLYVVMRERAMLRARSTMPRAAPRASPPAG